jgi:hypothetical protein
LYRRFQTNVTESCFVREDTFLLEPGTIRSRYIALLKREGLLTRETTLPLSYTTYRPRSNDGLDKKREKTSPVPKLHVSVMSVGPETDCAYKLLGARAVRQMFSITKGIYINVLAL